MTFKKWIYSCLGCVGVLALCIILMLKLIDHNWEKKRAERRAARKPVVFEEPEIIPLRDYSIEELIFHYTYLGNTAALDMLFLSGTDVNIRDEEGKTPLHEAAEYSGPAVVKYLIARGADINAGDDDGLQPIHKAALGKNVDSLRLLLDAGADIDARTDNLYTPLMFTIFESDSFPPDATVFLLNNGADVNAQEKNGWTCLHGAAFFRYENIAGILLKNGADPYIKNKSGESVFTIADQFPEKVILKLLKPYRKEESATTKSR